MCVNSFAVLKKSKLKLQRSKPKPDICLKPPNWSAICLPPPGVSKISPRPSPHTETLMAFFLQSAWACSLGTSSPWCARPYQWKENTAFRQDTRGDGWGKLGRWGEIHRKNWNTKYTFQNDKYESKINKLGKKMSLTVQCLQNIIFIIETTSLKNCPSSRIVYWYSSCSRVCCKVVYHIMNPLDVFCTFCLWWETNSPIELDKLS